MTQFTITEFNLDMGYISVQVEQPDGQLGTFTFYTQSVVSHSGANELEIVNGLRQLIAQRLAQLFPPPPPKPEALKSMLNKSYSVEA